MRFKKLSGQYVFSVKMRTVRRSMKWKVNTTATHTQAGAPLKLPRGNHHYHCFKYLPRNCYTWLCVSVFSFIFFWSLFPCTLTSDISPDLTCLHCPCSSMHFLHLIHLHWLSWLDGIPLNRHCIVCVNCVPNISSYDFTIIDNGPCTYLNQYLQVILPG